MMMSQELRVAWKMVEIKMIHQVVSQPMTDKIWSGYIHKTT